MEGRIIRAPVPAAMTPKVGMTVTPASTTWVYKVTTSRDPLRLRSGTGTSYKILGKYKKNTQVIVLSRSNPSWYEVSCPDGKHGWMSASYLTYVRDVVSPEATKAEIIEPRQLRDQPFRIYRIVPELDKITVYARHVFYDLLDNMIQSYKPSSSTAGASVVQEISERCLSEHDFTFYSDLDATAEEVAFENINPAEALLGENGVTGKYGGELARDWFDVFLVKRVGSDTSVRIREGKNLLGVSYDVDLTSVTTRIMPTGEDKDGNVLYLPELYVDSENIDAYPQPRWMHLPVSEAKEATKGDDRRTKAQCYALMRQECQKQFDAECDLPDITLKVDFINCAETEEYRDYAFLQNIYLGDAVRVVAPRIGVSVSMRMTQYTYDCLTRKYTDMTLGTVADTLEGNTISSRQLPNGIISGPKLAINSVGSGNLADASVTVKHMSSESVNTGALQAGSVTTEKLASGSVSTDKLAAGSVTTGKLDAGSVTTTKLSAGAVTSDKLDATTVDAYIARIANLEIGNAEIGYARIRDIVNEQLITKDGTADRYYIDKLRVNNLQVIEQTVGSLVIKAGNGYYYRLDVDAESGTVTPTRVTLTNSEIAAGVTSDGKRSIIETSLTVTDISATSIKGINAVIDRILASRLDVDTLFAMQAFVTKLYTSQIFGGKSLQIMISDTADAMDAAESASAEAENALSSAEDTAASVQAMQETVDDVRVNFEFGQSGIRTQRRNPDGTAATIYSTLVSDIGFDVEQQGEPIWRSARGAQFGEEINFIKPDAATGDYISIRRSADGGIVFTAMEV